MQSTKPNKYGIVLSSLLVASTSATRFFFRSHKKKIIGKAKENKNEITNAINESVLDSKRITERKVKTKNVLTGGTKRLVTILANLYDTFPFKIKLLFRYYSCF